MAMRMLAALAVIILFLLPATAMAGPEGTYFVEGTNPGGGGTYRGTATVRRNGQTYEVVWDVGGVRYVGTGLGATWVKGDLVMGAAAAKDVALSISYVSSGSYGLCFMIEQQNGQWQGIWTYGGSTTIGTEVWTRR